MKYEDLFIIAIEAFYSSVMKYSNKRKATFYTYAVNTISKELTRFFVNIVSESNYHALSLDAFSKEEGLTFDELYGEEDKRIKSPFESGNELREAMNKEEIISFLSDEENNERINLIMLELSGKNELSKREKYNLRRRIMYYQKKKDKDNH